MLLCVIMYMCCCVLEGFHRFEGFRLKTRESLEPMFSRTEIGINCFVVSSKVRPWYSVNFIRIGDVRKFWFLRGRNLIEKSDVVEIAFNGSNLLLYVW